MRREAVSPRRRICGFELRRAGGLALALVLAGFGAPEPGQAQEEGPQSVSPAGYEALDPVQSVMVDSGAAPPPPPAGPVSTLDPELYAALKEAAATSPDAEIPDEIVPLVFPKKNRSTEGGSDDGGLGLVTGEASTLRSYAGLDYAASMGADGQFRPPDTTLGKSGSRVLTATNSAIRLLMPSGSTLATKSLNDFFGTPLSDGVVFDPRVELFYSIQMMRA